MTKGIVAARREKFIKLMVNVTQASEMITVYKACFPNCISDKSARSACYRMLQDVDIVIAIDKLKQEKEEQYKKARQKEIEKLAKEQVVTEVQLDAVLSQIALGNYRKTKKVLAFNKSTSQFHSADVMEQPDETAMIAAANLLYKRKGSFAEKKIKHEAGDSFIEAMKAISERKNKKLNV